MKNNQWICGVLNGCQWLVALTQVNDVLEVISTIFAILSTVIIIVFKCISWWDKSKADKKISPEELEQLGEILKQSYDEIQEEVHEIKETHFGGNQAEEHPEVKKDDNT